MFFIRRPADPLISTIVEFKIHLTQESHITLRQIVHEASFVGSPTSDYVHDTCYSTNSAEYIIRDENNFVYLTQRTAVSTLNQGTQLVYTGCEIGPIANQRRVLLGLQYQWSTLLDPAMLLDSRYEQYYSSEYNAIVRFENIQILGCYIRIQCIADPGEHIDQVHARMGTLRNLLGIEDPMVGEVRSYPELAANLGVGFVLSNCLSSGGG